MDLRLGRVRARLVRKRGLRPGNPRENSSRVRCVTDWGRTGSSYSPPVVTRGWYSGKGMSEVRVSSRRCEAEAGKVGSVNDETGIWAARG